MWSVRLRQRAVTCIVPLCRVSCLQCVFFATWHTVPVVVPNWTCAPNSVTRVTIAVKKLIMNTDAIFVFPSFLRSRILIYKWSVVATGSAINESDEAVFGLLSAPAGLESLARLQIILWGEVIWWGCGALLWSSLPFKTVLLTAYDLQKYPFCAYCDVPPYH